MANKRTPSRRSSQTRLNNLALAAIAGQAGCVTLVIVLAALFIGLWLDSQFGRRGPFTFGLLCLSVPVSLYLMLRLTIGAINRIVPQPTKPKGKPKQPSEEE
jgi:hypothetical protein